MKIYVVSSLTHDDFGSLGRGWHESKLVAARANADEKNVQAFFKKLCDNGDATTEDIFQKAQTPVKAKTATSSKVKRAKTATNKTVGK